LRSEADPAISKMLTTCYIAKHTVKTGRSKQKENRNSATLEVSALYHQRHAVATKFGSKKTSNDFAKTSEVTKLQHRLTTATLAMRMTDSI
jgi:hypothetical protein